MELDDVCTDDTAECIYRKYDFPTCSFTRASRAATISELVLKFIEIVTCHYQLGEWSFAAAPSARSHHSTVISLPLSLFSVDDSDVHVTAQASHLWQNVSEWNKWKCVKKPHKWTERRAFNLQHSCLHGIKYELITCIDRETPERGPYHRHTCPEFLYS